ncbi:MAG: hypothetical protein WCA12_16785 [Burkholderiales bacterium]
MIRNPIDIASRVSPMLSALIESRVNDPEAAEPATLASVRIFVASLLSPGVKESERLHRFDINESVLDELDSLIEEFGGGALAIDFAQHAASEALSRVIEAVMNDDSRDNAPTLETVRDAIVMGLPSSLVGEGALEDDESGTLLAEVDGLIMRFGADALAERFLCSE